MKKKKRKIIVISIIIFLLLSSILIYSFFSIQLIGDSKIYLNVNDSYFENGYKATFLDKPYKNIDVTNNIDKTKVGSYYVKYSITLGFLKKSVKRKVFVVDNEKPIITLSGDEYMYLGRYKSYEEPGYITKDNIDGNITKKTIVTSNLDVNTVGVYEITYSVRDNVNNKRTVKRTVEVIENNLLASNVDEFWFNDLFDDVVLKYSETEYKYFEDTTFIGDSNTLFLHYNGEYISANQTWGKNNLNIAEINSSYFKTIVDNKNIKLNEALNSYHPKYLVVSTGINAPLYMKKDSYISEIKKFINYMKKSYKDTTIIFASTLPVNTGTLDISLQKKINEYNYYLLELCHEFKINYINFSDTVRNASGYADTDYFECTSKTNCGFHLNSKGKEKYINYIKHLDFGRKITWEKN